jgi:hypothetical protein
MLKVMDPDIVRSLLEGQPDILTAEAKKEAELYQNANCPMCYEKGAEKRMIASKIISGPNGPVVVVSPFSNGSLLPQGYAHCIHCNTDFNPRSGVIIKTEASMIAFPPSIPPPT